MQRREGGDNRILILAFRGCGKSTITGLYCTWLLWRDPDLRILVLAADLALARKMVRNVKRIGEKHPLTRPLKPARADQWGSDRFTVNRHKELRDPSMLAKGIGTNLTGTRADLIICDDVEVPKTCDSAAKREDLRERLCELDYILTSGGTMIYIGTPHHYLSIYADAPRGEEKEIFLSDYTRLTIPVIDAQGNSAWPERFTVEKIEAIRNKTGPAHFMSQMMCQPVNSADGKFDTNDLQVYDDAIEYSESGREPVLKIAGRRMVSAVAWWDPAFGCVGGDKSVIAVVYTCEQGEYWVHHIQAVLVSCDSSETEMDQQCAKVADIIRQYFIPVIAVEMNGIGAFLPGHLRRYLGRQGIACTVKEIVTRKAKNIRIMEAFDAVMAAQTLHVHRSATFNGLMSEMQEWRPDRKNNRDDALDAVAGALSLQGVRIPRIYGGKKQGWQGNAKVRVARTILDDQ